MNNLKQLLKQQEDKLKAKQGAGPQPAPNIQQPKPAVKITKNEAYGGINWGEAYKAYMAGHNAAVQAPLNLGNEVWPEPQPAHPADAFANLAGAWLNNKGLINENQDVVDPLILNPKAKKTSPLEAHIGTGLFDLTEKCMMIGSKYICNPVPITADEDWLIRVPAIRHKQFCQGLEKAGWKLLGEKENYKMNEMFDVYGKGDVDLIVTFSNSSYEAYKTAAELCKKLNLLKKDDRITVHETMLKVFF